jgi:acetoin utilization deacetylase AcuC-like enzyme
VGYADEVGEGAGLGYHRNFPLPKDTDDDAYCQTLTEAIGLIQNYAPRYLVVSFGADTFKDDPLGDLALTTDGFRRMGELVEGLHLPTLVVMEGGYANEALGRNTVAFLSALAQRPG